jgi:hypothetical protein
MKIINKNAKNENKKKKKKRKEKSGEIIFFYPL